MALLQALIAIGGGWRSIPDTDAPDDPLVRLVLPPENPEDDSSSFDELDQVIENSRRELANGVITIDEFNKIQETVSRARTAPATPIVLTNEDSVSLGQPMYCRQSSMQRRFIQESSDIDVLLQQVMQAADLQLDSGEITDYEYRIIRDKMMQSVSLIFSNPELPADRKMPVSPRPVKRVPKMTIIRVRHVQLRFGITELTC